MLYRLSSVLVATAALLSGAAGAKVGDAWHLQQILMHNKLDARAELVDFHVYPSGGTATVEVDGALGGVCPGDSVTMAFDWSMIAEDTFEGAVLPIILTSEVLNETPCKEALGAKAYVTVAGSDAKLPSPLSDRTMKAVDTRRFITVGDDDGRSYPAKGLGGGHRLLLVAADPLPGKPYAYFQIRIVIPGSERELRFVYVFSKDAAPMISPEIGNPPAPVG